MSANYHSSVTTATLWKHADINPLFEDLDAAISRLRVQMITCDGNITWNNSSGELAWNEPLRIVVFEPADGQMLTNVIASGAITLTTNQIVYADLSTVDGYVTSATSVNFSSASTELVPANRVILGMTNSSQLEFYPSKLIPSFSEILKPRESSITCAATFTVDFNVSEIQFLELTTDSSCIIQGGRNGQTYRLRVTQDGTGDWTLAIGATAGSIKWEGGVAPTITTAADKADWLTFIRSNSTWFGKADQNF